jgi:23S rRNA (guanosine2251-2'-O)-methyltransferase
MSYIFGFHALISRLRHHPESVETVFFDAQRQDPRLKDVIARAELAGCRLEATDAKRLDGLAQNGRHQGVAAKVKPLTGVTLDDVLTVDSPFLLVLDGVTDPHNLGAVLRTADAFGVHAVIVPKDRSVGVNATVAKVACGAADTVPVIPVTNLARTLDTLKSHDIWCVAADMGGENLFDATLTGSIAWVMGAEGHGLRRLTKERCDRVVSIPLSGTVESLNVSVATGICLAETARQRKH